MKIKYLAPFFATSVLAGCTQQELSFTARALEAAVNANSDSSYTNNNSMTPVYNQRSTYTPPAVVQPDFDSIRRTSPLLNGQSGGSTNLLTSDTGFISMPPQGSSVRHNPPKPERRCFQVGCAIN